MEYSITVDNKVKITSRHSLGSYTETMDNFTLRFVFDGNETCMLGRRYLSIHNDSFIILNKGTQITSTVADASVTIFTIEFDDDFLSDFNQLLKSETDFLGKGFDYPDCLKQDLRETIYPFRGDMRVAVSQLKWLLDNGKESSNLISGCIAQCLMGYYRVYDEEILQKATRLNFLHHNTRIEILRRLNLAKEYLYANYNRNVNLESLADHACLSVNHLLRTFKLAYKQSPHQFLIQLRLQRAQLLLTKTEYPVYEIVNMVGFKCTSSFIRLFRTRYKTTPLKYRNVLAA